MDDLARELNARAVEAPPPGRKGGRPSQHRKQGEPCSRWNRNGVRAILKNPRYTGALVWNRRSRGKYHRLHEGTVIAKGKAGDMANAPERWEVVAAAHEPLVTQQLFDRVQTRMMANRGTKPSVGAYLFSGLITCSHCGRTLAGLNRKGRRVYRCHKYDDAGEVVCGFNAVGEEWLLDRVLRVLQEEMLAPERLAALRDEVRRQDDAARAADALDPLTRRLSDLDTWIKQGNENLAILPPDRIPNVIATLRDWERERDRLRVELDHRRRGGNLEGLNDVIKVCEALLWRLRDAVNSADPLFLREVIREAIARVELSWERKPYGRRTRYVLKGGVIHLRPQEGEDEKWPALPRKPCSNTTSGPSPAST